MPNKNGRVIYRGISRIDQKTPIKVILTGLTGKGSANPKTGAMLQTWILIDDDVKPHMHVKEGTDHAICGDCPFAGGRGCYVTAFHAPNGTHRCDTIGKGYDEVGLDGLAKLAAGRKVRIGSYGDPAAVPAEVWRELIRDAVTTTGYTHQWRNPDNADYAVFCMASVETAVQIEEAAALGFRTFRVTDGVDILSGIEALCPASEEGGRKTTCLDCGLCEGNTKAARNISIPAHGATSKRAINSLKMVG